MDTLVRVQTQYITEFKKHIAQIAGDDVYGFGDYVSVVKKTTSGCMDAVEVNK